ncbi:tRNA (adenosine(37)-N6)-dimethylallyltransferase MiaA [Lederbergia sp. NSJ-179]|uniref:tRNA (adenosine(37)-N6)-dimethylallyltransferase MiaA n=1 Tax=Lederbergia sp. NSJ-179 TaxID=2931402 RepID=UPI001FD060FF|nr:tRNA (adenosine(37)-N6)-dimethylallyltransferase MiaA [Lederbergia sp. NSJ-179]MCJ7841209.1 tRNA (adenosine(37)-N6)-dimethylallyltransferase MiaA [Lederbergia sp. NSJ-179]
MPNKQKRTVISVIGPTAVGKTEISLQIAKQFGGEIISGDSMQIYRGMDIGTAKIKLSEMKGIPHHLLDMKDPCESFSAAEFQKIVRKKIEEVHRRGHLPILVGGTGLYIQSVLYDYQFSDAPADFDFRKKMEEYVQAGQAMGLYNQLRSIDPEAAKKIHPNNHRRVIRALEIFYCTGKTMTEFQKSQQNIPLYNDVLIGLTMEREKLYHRIDQRVDKMIEEGLVEEVRDLIKKGVNLECQAMKAIGYKEIFDYLEARISYDQAITLLKKHSRNYAKRQLTWFRNKMNAHWFDLDDEREYCKKIAEILAFIAGKLEIKSNN